MLEQWSVSSEKAPDMNGGHGSIRLPQFSKRGIYSPTLALVGMLLGSGSISAQGVFLKAGDSYSFKFNSLPFSHLENLSETPPQFYPTTSAGFWTINAANYSYNPREAPVINTQENSGPPSESDLHAIVYEFPTSGGLQNGWQDLEGFLRIDVLSGSMNLTSIGIRVHMPEAGDTYRVYENLFIVPEPASIALFVVGVLLLLCRARLRRKTPPCQRCRLIPVPEVSR
jgi:hypothetical protein